MAGAGCNGHVTTAGFGAPAPVLWDTGLWGGGVGGSTPSRGEQGSARGTRSGYGAMSLVQAPMTPWGWDNAGRAGLPVLPGIREGPKGTSWAAREGPPSPGGHGGAVRLFAGRLGGTRGARREQHAYGAFLAFPACCLLPSGGGGGRYRLEGGVGGGASPCPTAQSCVGGMLVCGSTEGAHWLHGGPAALAGVTGPARSCVVQMPEGCCAERRAGRRCPLPGFWGTHQSRAAPRAWHRRVPRHGSFHSGVARNHSPSHCPYHSHCRCPHHE